MAKTSGPHLSRRERQIMDLVYERKAATAAEVLEALPDPPSYSAVRATLRILEDKGHLQHRQDGPRMSFTHCSQRPGTAVGVETHAFDVL